MASHVPTVSHWLSLSLFIGYNAPTKRVALCWALRKTRS